MPSPAPLPKCPKCNSIIPPTRSACVSCGLAVSRMDEYRNSRDASRTRSVASTESFWSTYGRFIKWGVIAPLIVITLYVGYKFIWNGKPASTLPTNPEVAVSTYLKLIGGDGDKNNASHKAAYAMIAASSKNPSSETEPDRFLQYHHDVYTYFADLTTDKNWFDHARIAPDPKRADVYEIKIGPEIVHIGVVDEATDSERKSGTHYFAVTPILEIDPNSDARRKAGSEEARIGVVRGIAGEGAVDNLKAIAALSARPHESAMDKKMRLFPRLSSPRSPDLDRDIISLWPIRTDPAVIFRLNQLIDDERYNVVSRDRARQVINGSLDEETRAAVGVE